MEWIITCKVDGKDGYQVFDAFNELGAIDWHISQSIKNIQIGDIVYIYVGVPYKKIMIKTKCTQLNILKESFLDDTKFGGEPYNPSNAGSSYMRLKLQENIISDNRLSLDFLKSEGLVNGNIQGTLKSNNNEQLFTHIHKIFESHYFESYKHLNEPRIKTVQEWEAILKYEMNKENGFDFIGKVLLEAYHAPNHTIFAHDLEKKIGEGGLNARIGEFKNRIKRIPGIELSEQLRTDSDNYRSWNIPFTSSEEINNLPENKNKFCWILRKELIQAMENVLPQLQTKRILFCNIAYMKKYDAVSFEEIPIHGGSYVSETKDAFEKNNFHICEDGFVRGFVETKYVGGAFEEHKKPKQLHIEQIDSIYTKKDSINNVMVVFCAHSPEKNNTVIVGWYKNATVHRNREMYADRQFNLITKAENAVLLKESKRHKVVPRASQNENNLGFGQANVWYANKPDHQSFVNEVFEYIDTTEKSEIVNSTIQQNRQQDDLLNSSIKSVYLDKNFVFEYTDEIVSKPLPTIKKGVEYYKRDRQRAINALSHAKYMCENNPNHESFTRKKDGVRYTEAHHLIPMAQQSNFDVSLDIEENIVSLCSNCHNEIHYGENAKLLITKLYHQRKHLLKSKKIDITLEQLLSYYK